VNIPAKGAVALAFVQRKEGATLNLRVEGGEEGVEAILLPSPVSLPVSLETVSLWAVLGLSSQEDKGVRTFTALPAGHARLLLVAGNAPRFHLEELELPAEGTVERVVHPSWQPFPAR
jgi:hypothetical protein